MSDHLTPEDFFEFIDRGGGRGPVGRHLLSCAECLFELDVLLLAEAPATPEEEAILDELPAVNVEDVLERMRPVSLWRRDTQIKTAAPLASSEYLPSLFSFSV